MGGRGKTAPLDYIPPEPVGVSGAGGDESVDAQLWHADYLAGLRSADYARSTASYRQTYVERFRDVTQDPATRFHAAGYVAAMEPPTSQVKPANYYQEASQTLGVTDPASKDDFERGYRQGRRALDRLRRGGS